MTLILRKRGKLTERTKWNLSFSGISLSHKRGWITLNTRGRSEIDLPGPLFTFRVGPTGTFLWFIAFVIFDIIAFIVKVLSLPILALIDGIHELWFEEVEEREIAVGWGFVAAAVAGIALEIFLYLRYVQPIVEKIF